MLIGALKKVDKRKRYLVQAFLACVFVVVLGLDIVKLSNYHIGLLLLVFTVAGTYILHYPNIHFSNILPSILLPLGTVGASVLTMRTYPDFGGVLKSMVVLYTGFMYYLVSLMDNIFLVVYERDESIPLYRVATSWSQIVQILIAIPLFASILKFDLKGYEQSAVLFTISFVSIMHQIWIQSFDVDTKRVGVGEMLLLSVIGAFLVFAGSVSVSHIPAEGFLRALLSASVLLFAINYVIGYLKNEISKKSIIQYLTIILFFFGLLVFFAA